MRDSIVLSSVVMRRQLLSIFLLSLSLWPLIKCQGNQVEGVEKLQGLIGDYKGKLESTIKLVKLNKDAEGGNQLKEAKKALSKIATLVKTDPKLQSIPGIKELSGPLTKLVEITEKLTANLDVLLESAGQVFGILNQVTSKVQEAGGGAAGGVAGGLPLG